MFRGLLLTCAAACWAAIPAYAQSARISQDRATLEVTVNGNPLEISRQGAPCPPACVQPMQSAAGVVTIGEAEVLDFIEAFVANGTGLLIDTRLPDGFAAGTVPGAVNVPAATLAPSNAYRTDLLNALGVRGTDFLGAFDLVLFGEGPTSGDVVQAVKDLAAAGYPVEKLKYYRGGFFVWQTLGLTVATAQ